MKKFYLNRDFFNHYVGCSIPVWDNVYLFFKSVQTKQFGYKSFLEVDAYFEVSTAVNQFFPIFHCTINVSNRQIKVTSLDYILDSQLRIASIKYFPLSPAWLLPCTNYHQFLNRCALSLRVYRKEDLI